MPVIPHWFWAAARLPAQIGVRSAGQLWHVGMCGMAWCAMGGRTTAAAQAMAPLEPRSKWERWVDEVPVSGGVIVGVMASAARSPVDLNALTVELPRSAAGPLCVEVSSHDGRYSARLEYDLGPSRARTAIALRLPTQYGSRLRSYTASELVVLARLTRKCGDPQGAIVPAAWSQTGRGDTVYVFANSRVPTDVLGGVGAAAQYEARCVEVVGVTTAFNLRCAVPRAWLAPNARFVLRTREGRAFQYYQLPLRGR